MRPVAIFRHSRTEGPGYFAIFLERFGIPWILIPIDEHAPIPADVSAYSGIGLMGGPMSVNDDLPWIDSICRFIRSSMTQGVPVIGHCLGGQLMCKALGGKVIRNTCKEIGWHSVHAVDNATSREWLGEAAGKSLPLFHWHGETFSLPAEATLILSSEACARQAFVLGPHLAMQCHVEMTPEMIRTWSRSLGDELNGSTTSAPSIQPAEAMIADTERNMPSMRLWADRLYSRWALGLRH